MDLKYKNKQRFQKVCHEEKMKPKPFLNCCPRKGLGDYGDPWGKEKNQQK